jgi:hypothetical protein
MKKQLPILALILLMISASCYLTDEKTTKNNTLKTKITEIPNKMIYRFENDEVVCYGLLGYKKGGLSCQFKNHHRGE